MTDGGQVDTKGRQDHLGLLCRGCLHVLVVIYQESSLQFLLLVDKFTCCIGAGFAGWYFTC